MPGGRVQLQAYSFQRGINRFSSRLELPEGFVRDAYNVLPRIPGGVQVVKPTTVKQADAGAEVTALFSYYKSDGSFLLIARLSSGYKYSADAATWTAITGAPSVGSGTHSMASYRGLLVIGEEGSTLTFWDGVAGSAWTDTKYPKGGLVVELGGRLCVAGEQVGTIGSSGAPTFPDLKIPCYGLKLPMAEVTRSWTGTVTIADQSSGVSRLTKVTGSNFANYVGFTAVIGGQAFKITAYTTTTVDVSKQDSSPAPTTGAVTLDIYDTTTSPFLVAYPSPNPIDLGTTALGADTGSVTVRVFNRSPIAIRIVDIRAKGVDFRVEDLPALPYSIPAHGSASFKVIGNPTSYGDSSNYLFGSLVIEHDLAAQSSLTIQTRLTCVRSAVLATPSCLDFGAWLSGDSPTLKVTISNPLADSISYKFSSTSATPFAASGAPTTWTVIGAKQQVALSVVYTPTTNTGDTNTFTVNRDQVGDPSRLRMSQVGDYTTWDLDYDWLSLNQGDSFYGKPTALWNYDDAVIAFKDSEIGIVTITGGEIPFAYKQLTLGKGIGALCQNAVTAGDGSLWWVAKTGVYRLTAQTVDPIDLPILDVLKAVSASDFSKVCATYYDGFFVWSAPWTGLDVSEGLWWYQAQGQSWWRTTCHTPTVAGLVSKQATALCVRRGASDKPTLYGASKIVAVATTYPVSVLDDQTATGAPTGGYDFSITPGFYAGGDPASNKFIEACSVVSDVAGHFSDGSLSVLTNHGDTVKGIMEAPARTILYCGIGAFSGGVLTDANQAWAADALIGAKLEVGSASYDITDNAATTVTYAGAESGTLSYRITQANASGIVTTPMYLRECYGASFQIGLSGVKVASTLGNLYGLTVHLVPMNPFGGERGRVP